MASRKKHINPHTKNSFLISGRSHQNSGVGVKVAVSGYFNPLHVGHLEMLKKAKKLGDFLVVIVNNDKQVALKEAVPFMDEKDRMKIVASLKPIDKVVLSMDINDTSVVKTLAKLKPDIFANGGDRRTANDIPEADICRRLGIKMVFGVGKKIRSSSVLIKNAAGNHLKKPTEQRPWGYYTVLLEGCGYKIKKYVVNPGQSMSLQMHKKRSEHWVIISGTAHIQCGEKFLQLCAGKSTFIPIKTKHRVINKGKSTLEVVEVQNGEYLGEDDIVRFEDKYRRA